MTDRGVSPTLNYVLATAIALVMLTGLLVSGTNFVAQQNDEVSTTEMEVVAQRLAADVQTADRLVTAGHGDTTVELETSTPRTIVGSHYRIELRDETDRQVVWLRSTDTDITVSVRVPTDVPVKDGASASGGDVVVEYDGSALEDGSPGLVIRNA